MIICLCRAVTDGAVAEAIGQGCRSLEEVARCTGAGTGCGTCRASIQRTLDDTVARRKRSLVMLPLVAVSS
jgi:NAD(P)H-nitrite reductase large subunit